MIDNFTYKCLNFSQGCKIFLKGKDYNIARHITNECVFRDVNANKPLNDKWYCCNRVFNEKEKSGVNYGTHLCNLTQNASFCISHKQPENYLITIDKIESKKD